eukprot:TRINITY_DN8933_c0_g4_i2.p2 TRINITY_DN8933_c0_g4~~TRINITY_DN8933_c0_g4_i2.p2  ORF type:complete len:173 (-),score=8.55 TRINITY_DN8933_c0_g4_i2:382-900(-)
MLVKISKKLNFHICQIIFYRSTLSRKQGLFVNYVQRLIFQQERIFLFGLKNRKKNNLKGMPKGEENSQKTKPKQNFAVVTTPFSNIITIYNFGGYNVFQLYRNFFDNSNQKNVSNMFSKTYFIQIFHVKSLKFLKGVATFVDKIEFPGRISSILATLLVITTVQIFWGLFGY